MRYVKVDAVPEKRVGYNDLQGIIKAFMSYDSIEVARLDWKDNEYKDSLSCYKSLMSAVKRSGENIKVCLRGNEVYMKKIF